jgi:hypothetical protein
MPPKLDPHNLTVQQYRALTKIAAGYSNNETAATMGVSIKCIESWRKLPGFKQLLREALSQCFDAAVSELVLHSQQAAKELSRIAFDPDTPSRVRVSAITAMLTFGSKAKDAHLENRLEQLEKAISYDPLETEVTEPRKYFPDSIDESEFGT